MTTLRQAGLLIAPAAFKGTLTARRVSAAMARGACAFARGRIALQLDICPLADGGDGSLDSLITSGFTRVMTNTRGATGDAGVASIGIGNGVVAVETANACGLARQIPFGLDPLGASSHGLGDAILSALAYEPDTLVIFLGGSASTDGGTGMLQALGVSLMDAHGNTVGASGRTLRAITEIDPTGLDPRLTDVDIVIATDVTSPLTGPEGAAYVFAPQKGATPDQVITLEAGLQHWQGVLAEATGVDAADEPGAGAAGGVGAAAISVLGARYRSGFDVISEYVRLSERLASADAVITGEGAFDSQSALGKGTGRLLAQADTRGLPVGLVCGRIDIPTEGLLGTSTIAAIALGDHGMEEPSVAVEVATQHVVRRLLQ